MTNMKKPPYSILVLAGFTLWILETWYFGWNMKAQSAPESILDAISWSLIVWGIIGDILSGIIIIKNDHKNDQ